MNRPALAHVLAATADVPPSGAAVGATLPTWWAYALPDVRCSPAGVWPWRESDEVWPWREDAFDSLLSRGLLPERWSDPQRAPRWSVPWGCGGACRRGALAAWCAECDGYDAPPEDDRPALVAVASVGAAAIARVEAIVAEGRPGARIQWRALDRVRLRLHHRDHSMLWVANSNASPEVLFSREHEYASASLPGLASQWAPWPVRPPTRKTKGRRMWRFVRGIAVEDVDDGVTRRTGFHLLGCDPGCVVLGLLRWEGDP